MDIMMPVIDGQVALQEIRQLEKDFGLRSDEVAKVIMTTALNDKKEVVDAFYKGMAASYFVKPFEVDEFVKELKVLGLLAEYNG
jgi:two-component system chemotaxis response regulator CheY